VAHLERSAEEAMKPKTVIYLLFLGGCVSLIALWAWALAPGVELIPVTVAVTATAFLCYASATVAAKKIREDARLSIGDVASAASLIAVAPALIGACVLIWEYVPSKTGNGSHLDRRYSLLFFAMAVYLLVFPFLSSRKAR
jgi:hypothetical protein